jgi:hypothetical protein
MYTEISQGTMHETEFCFKRDTTIVEAYEMLQTLRDYKVLSGSGAYYWF